MTGPVSSGRYPTVPNTKIEDRSLLWENPNPTEKFAAQTITLKSDDYDILEVLCYSTLSVGSLYFRIAKGSSYRAATGSDSGTTVIMITRDFHFVDARSYSITDCAFVRQGQAREIQNNILLPQKIYGIKYYKQ